MKIASRGRGFAPEIGGTVKPKCFEQTFRQLDLLGYKEGDRVYLRLLVPKGIPDSYLLEHNLGWRDKEDRTRKATVDGYLTLGETGSCTFTRIYADGSEKTWNDGLGILKWWNRKGYGVYLVVNPGGRKDDEIDECRVQFWENDLISKNEQWHKIEFIERRADKQVSLIIETFKSLHCYLVRTKPTHPNEWKVFQEQIIQGVDSDPAIRNFARLMRLVGFDHVRWENDHLEFFPVRIVRQASSAWSDEDLDDILPDWDEEYWGIQDEKAVAKPSDPIDNPWDIRNFADYLEGFQSKGREDWDTCRCPVHNGDSSDSLHINRATGAYKCHDGCQSGAVYEAAVAVAIAAGYKFPEPGDPDPDWYEQLIAQQQAQEEYNLTESEGFEARAKQERIEGWRERTAAIQAEMSTLRVEPTVRASGKYIPKNMIYLPEKSGIVLIDAPKNSGKTSNGLINLINQHRERYPLAPRFLGVPRRILAQQAGQVLSLPVMSSVLHSPIREAALCLESIGRLGDPEFWPDHPPLLILDEPSQTLKQLLDGGTTKSNHAFVLSRFRAVMEAIFDRDGCIVLCEDKLSNLELDMVAEASKLDVVEYFKFDKQVTPRDFSLYDSPSLTWCEIQERLSKGENVMAAVDSQRWLREIEHNLVESGILDASEAWIIDSESNQDAWVREFVDDPTKWICKEHPRFLGYSPTLSSGVSIEDPGLHFSSQAFHIIHLEPRDAAQLVDRLRSDVPRFGYVKEHVNHDDDLFSGSRPEAVLRNLDRNKAGIEKLTDFAEYVCQKEQTSSVMDTMNRLEAEKDNPNTDYGWYRRNFAKYKARQYYNCQDLRANLIQVWEAEGHNVQFKPLSKIKHCIEERKEAREALDTQEAELFSQIDTSGISLDWARLTLDQLDSSREDRRTARKVILQEKLPGCPLDDQNFVLKAIVKDSGRFLRTTEMLWLSKNPEAAQFLDRISWHGAYSHAAKHGVFVADHRLTIRSGQAKLLNECPLGPFITGEVERWTNKSPEAIAVKDWAMFHAHQLKRYLRLTIHEDHTPCQIVNKLLKKLGFTVEAIARPGKRSEKRNTVYAITNLQDVERDRILESLAERLKLESERRGESVPVSVGMVQIENIKAWTHRLKDAGSDQDLVTTFMEMRRVYPEKKHPTKQAVWENLDRDMKLRIERLWKGVSVT